MARVLLVEDSQTQALELALMVQGAGFEVEVAASAEEGLERLNHRPFDLIVTDLQLPGMSGVDLCRYIKADSNRRALPVVLLTRWADPVNVLEALAAGADGFITKGRDAEEIIRRLRQTLAEHVPPKPTDLQELTTVVYQNRSFPISVGRERLLRSLILAFEDQVQLDRLRQTEVALRKQVEEELRKRTAELEAANRGLQHEVAERRRAEEGVRQLLQEIHHRVKNNLAVISSLFYLGSTYTTDGRTVQLLQEAQDRIRSMALVHETLYRSGNLASVNFGEYVQALLVHLSNTYQIRREQVRLRTDPEELLLTVELAIPCGLIVNELVTNCLKHAFASCRGGEICVRWHRTQEGRCVVTVADNGVGIPPDFDVQKARTLGLRIVRSLTEQLHGQFEIVGLNPGTAARLTFSPPGGAEESIAHDRSSHSDRRGRETHRRGTAGPT